MYNFYLWFYPVMAAIVGVFIGSFINVVIYRLPLMIYAQSNGEPDAGKINLWWPPSHCPGCGTPVWRRDNIPVLSWLLRKGKCRHCNGHISAQYLISEILCGVFFTLLTLKAWPNFTEAQICCFFLYFCLLYTLSVIDFQHLLLPDTLVSLLLWSGLVASISGLTGLQPRSAIVGAVAAWLLLYSVMTGYEKLRGREGLGYGDVKLMAAISAWLGIEKLPELIVWSAVSGIVIYVLCACLNKRRALHENADEAEKHYIPFGPSISVAALVLFFSGQF
ncbi:MULTISPECIES: prepilin peptidase [Enterobacterales]|uniref:prepilin peptidase n=1 Tax=Enterobacterales TaxID=91347 RepID=UPI002ED99B9A